MACLYDSPTSTYVSSIPPGTRAFREEVSVAFGFAWTEVVRDSGRCAGQRSRHCQCAAIDFFEHRDHRPVPHAKGRRLFEWCLSVMDKLQVQGVIFSLRCAGLGGACTERAYGGAHDHKDHVHVEFTNWAAQHLTRDMVKALLPGGEGVSKQDVIDALNEYGKAADGSTWASRLDADTDQLKPILNLVTGIANGTIQVICKGGTGGAGITEAQVEAACTRAVAKLKLTTG